LHKKLPGNRATHCNHTHDFIARGARKEFPAPKKICPEACAVGKGKNNRASKEAFAEILAMG
jgi:hypothetical protein